MYGAETRTNTDGIPSLNYENNTRSYDSVCRILHLLIHFQHEIKNKILSTHLGPYGVGGQGGQSPVIKYQILDK